MFLKLGSLLSDTLPEGNKATHFALHCGLANNVLTFSGPRNLIPASMNVPGIRTSGTLQCVPTVGSMKPEGNVVLLTGLLDVRGIAI